VHHQRVARRQRHDEVFRPASHPDNSLTEQAFHEVSRERRTQIRPAEQNPFESRTRHRRLQAAAYGFDFRELRHDQMVTAGALSRRDGADDARRPAWWRRAGTAFA
jgi:hypothetical protein